MQRETLKGSVPNGVSLSHLFSQGSWIYKGGKICKDHSWLQGSSVFPTCQGTLRCELKDCDNCVWPSQTWARQSPGAEKGSRHKIPPQPRSCLQLVIAGRQNIGFLQGSDIGCINHIPVQAPCSGVGFWCYGWLWFQAALDISTHLGRRTGCYVPQREESEIPCAHMGSDFGYQCYVGAFWDIGTFVGRRKGYHVHSKGRSCEIYVPPWEVNLSVTHLHGK